MYGKGLQIPLGVQLDDTVIDHFMYILFHLCEITGIIEEYQCCALVRRVFDNADKFFYV